MPSSSSFSSAADRAEQTGYEDGESPRTVGAESPFATRFAAAGPAEDGCEDSTVGEDVALSDCGLPSDFGSSMRCGSACFCALLSSAMCSLNH